LQQLSFTVLWVGEVADTLGWKKICTGRQQSEVLCPHILWRVQVLPDACRHLPFSELCFSFINPGRKELRERKRKEKKHSPELADCSLS
jgi:hypothetical protein